MFEEYECLGFFHTYILDMKRDKSHDAQCTYMKDWILDVIIGISAIILFAILLLALPHVLPAAYGYVAAFLIFVAYLTIAGLTAIKSSIIK